MTTHKWIDRICCIAVVLAMLISVVFLNADALGIQAADRVMGYENKLFDAATVHTIDIIIDDWDSFLSTCQSEEYSVCNVVIDGEAYKNVGIRGKGNTSLSTVSSMDSERYSFKIEFDQYDSTKSYYGLDKLCLNNIIQDNTYMKDFLVYQMMAEFGVDAPLCSYVYITVNGEDWGLYLAVEGVEDAFLQRNYGTNYGELYKPDSLSMGGGRGNGKEFDMEDIDFSQFENFKGFGNEENSGENAEQNAAGGNSSGDAEATNPFEGGGFPGGGNMQMPDMSGDTSMGGMQMPGMNGDTSTDGSMQMPSMPEGMEMPDMSGMELPEDMELPEGMEDFAAGMKDFASNGKDFSGKGGGMSFGMGSDDVKLQYIDDDPSSYSNIFNNAKTDITEADQERLIASLKALSEGEDIASVVDIEEVIRYFVVHNFVVNGDSYTGSMIHNYYLYEEDGQLSMIPWDYNLAFGTFQGNNAESAVNDPIDSPVSGGSEDRPMVNWIFESEEYTELYHEYFAEFIEQFFDSGWLTELIDSTAELIAPYVEKDPTKFCTYEEFETGVATIREFCLLRAESVSGQLSGTIPSTSDGQSADSSTLVDASGISLNDMGTMNTGGGSFGGGGRGDWNTSGDSNGNADGTTTGGGRGNKGSRGDRSENSQNTEQPENSTASGSMEMPEGMQMPEGMEMPEDMQMPEGMEAPEGMEFPTDGTMPDMSQNSGMQFPGMTGGSGSSNTTQLALLGGSLACLLAGLLVAFKYRR